MAGDAARAQRERELKFDVPDGWQLPDLTDLTPPGGSVQRASLRLESTYHDTADRDLLRARMTLRRRSGDADTGWQLKVPAGDARLELREPPGSELPDVLADLTAGVRRGAPLHPVATLATERSAHRLVDADGRTLVEIAVDDVHATAFGEAAVVSRWREVEAELAEGDEKLLARVRDRLLASGCRPAAGASKLARALDHRPASARPGTGLAALIADYLDAQYAAILAGDLELRRGRDVVHKTRVATRRYRSALRVFAEVLDGGRAGELDAELAWFADTLGELRDRHVLRDHLDAALAQLPPELVLGPVAARIHHMIDADLADAQVELDAAMVGPRYYALLAELRDWHERPPLRTDRPAADAARFLRRARRTLRRRLRRASAADPEQRDAAMHRARKAAKRLRYAAELGAPELGAPAEHLRKRAKKVQERLGVRQDDVVAAEFLLRAGRVAGTTPGENGFTFGLLYQRERDAAAAADR